MTCERRLGGYEDGLVCTGSGEGHTHTYEASAGPDHEGGHRHADMEES